MLSGEGSRVFECIVHITRDKSRVIQVDTCDIARLGVESNAIWFGSDIKSRSICRRRWAEYCVAKYNRGSHTFDTYGAGAELDSE